MRRNRMSAPVPARFLARVEGRVQGVGYRYFVHRRACELHVAGSVRNLPGGGVQVDAEGTREALDALAQDLHRGPPASRVERVLLEWHPPRGAREFRIEAGW